MSATTINFVRHGKVYNPNHVLYERLPGFHLSTSGRRMAETTGRYIAESPQLNTATAVYSSPLDRTRETADAILIELNALRAERGQEQLKLLTDKRLIEAGNDFRGKRIGHGDGALWRPENLKLVRNLWRPTWGESYRSIANRVQDFALEKSTSTPASRSWSFRTNRRSGHTGTCSKPGTPSTTCCCARRRSHRSHPSPTTTRRTRCSASRTPTPSRRPKPRRTTAQGSDRHNPWKIRGGIVWTA